jgi:hypothetical protein
LHRVRLSPKKIIESLSARVKILEELLRLNGVEVPSNTADEPLIRESNIETQNKESRRNSSMDDGFDTLNCPSNSIDNSDHALEIAQTPLGDPFLLILQDEQMPGRLSGGTSDINTLTGQHISSITYHSDEDDQCADTGIETEQQSHDDSIVDQLSARMGSFQIAEDGQLRYFGPTSNLHILHNGLFSLSRPLIRSMRTEGPEILKRAGLGQYVDPEVEKYLARLYFAWEDPAIHVVDEDMYYGEQCKWNSGQGGSPFYSETLKNAM